MQHTETRFGLTSVTIRNFRCIKDITVHLDRKTTVLIGENNTGKTTFLQAIRICLERLRGQSRKVFDEYDYHLSSEDAAPANADPIEITLSFAEPAPDSWEEGIIQEFGDLAIQNDSECYEVRFHLHSHFNEQTGEFELEWDFLDAENEPLRGKNRTASGITTLQRLAPGFYLPALRDAAKHFDVRGRFWRIFLEDSSIPDPERQAMEEEFAKLNNQLINAHQPLADVRSKLEDANKVIDLGSGDTVSIDALPTRMFELLSKTQVNLSAGTGAKIPVGRQGEGTQSLAVLLLFGAFFDNKMSGLDSLAHPITALEEPEAHLHPSAIRSLADLVHDLPGQKILSSHNGDLLASVDPLSIRRFARQGDNISVHHISPDTLDEKETRQFNFHIRRHRGELLFARCWLLVEGETEVVLFPGAADALGIDLERAGVRCVEYSQSNVGMLAKIANQLGIEWYCVIDNDDAGIRDYEPKIINQLNGISKTDRRILPYINPELFLCENGFGDLYESRMSRQKTQPVSPKETPEYWREVLQALPSGNKPEIALEAVEIMRKDKSKVPSVLKEIIEKTVHLAEQPQ